MGTIAYRGFVCTYYQRSTGIYLGECFGLGNPMYFAASSENEMKVRFEKAIDKYKTQEAKKKLLGVK